MFILAAILMGFVGSLHCLGMCGPIVLMLSGGQRGKAFWINRLSYNLGRMIAYVLLGAVVGLMGHSIHLAGFQQSLSIAIGISWLGILIFRPAWEQTLTASKVFRPFYLKIKAELSVLFSNKKKSHFQFNAGILNGFLPCGMVYLALSAALLSGSWLDALAFMAAFGLGTFPAMLGLSVLFQKQGLEKLDLNRLIRGFSILFAILLIIRGLDLGMGIWSPELLQVSMDTNTCQ